MPSNPVQARIAAFEKALTSNGGPSNHSHQSSTSSGTSSSVTTPIDLLEAPLEPGSPGSSTFLPIQPRKLPLAAGRSPSPSPPNLGARTSLVDLGDWILDDGNSSSSGSYPSSYSAHHPPKPVMKRSVSDSNHPPLISFGSPPHNTGVGIPVKKAPALPPRKQTSYSSLKSVSSASSSSPAGSYPPPPLPKRADSLGISDALNQYNNKDSLSLPPRSPTHHHISSSTGTASRSPTKGHASASSVSSFHSVSLSSDGARTPDAVTTTFPSTAQVAPPISSPSPSYFHAANGRSGGQPLLPSQLQIRSHPSGSSTASSSLIGGESFENVVIQRDSGHGRDSFDDATSPVSSSSVGYSDWENITSSALATPRLSSQPQQRRQNQGSPTWSPPLTAKPYATYRSPSSPNKQHQQHLGLYPPTAALSCTSSLSGSSGSARRVPPAIPPKRIVPGSTSPAPPSFPPKPASLSSSRSSTSTLLGSQPALSRPQSQLQLGHNQAGRPNTKPIFPIKASVLRPTPVPQAARARYEPVFHANVERCRGTQKLKRKGSSSGGSEGITSAKEGGDVKATPRKPRNAGWRGLSVDLITGDDLSFLEDSSSPSSPKNEEGDQTTEKQKQDDWSPTEEERLEGWVVKMIWRKSKLGKNILSDIWSECDPHRQGSLDCSSFVRGMWRIDEELRKAASRSRRRAGASSSSRYPYSGTRSRSGSTSTVGTTSSFSHASHSQPGQWGNPSYPVPPLPSAASKPPGAAALNTKPGFNPSAGGSSSTTVGAWNRGGSGGPLLPPPHAAFSGLKAGLSGGLGVLNQVAGHATNWGR